MVDGNTQLGRHLTTLCLVRPFLSRFMVWVLLKRRVPVLCGGTCWRELRSRPKISHILSVCSILQDEISHPHVEGHLILLAAVVHGVHPVEALPRSPGSGPKSAPKRVGDE